MRHLMFIVIMLTFSLPLSSQTVKVNEPDVCFNCHGEFEDMSSMKHIHTAFDAGMCSDCHNPHASKHAVLLYDGINNLCLKCHEGTGDKLNLDHVHQPVQSGNCTECHEPHASAEPNQLKYAMTELCAGCHTEVEQWTKYNYVHQPIAQNQCQKCHDSHGSTEDKLLTEEVSKLCLGCHASDNKYLAAHKDNAMKDANCVTCHDPHSSSVKGLIMVNQHKPFSSGQCKSCHASEGGSVTFALNNEPKDLCFKCHRTLAQNDQLAYHHIMDDEQSCLNCHNAHASPTSSLLSMKQTTLCMSCHFNDNPDKPKEFFVTHNGSDCTNCHVPHGSDTKEYLKLDGIELCVQCHVDAHRGSHPIGEEVIDPRTDEMVTCLSCHQLHGAEFKQYLPLNSKMDLCIQCHKR